MKESTIVASFRKTGVVPFDPTVITPNMMAPSIRHSSHGELPLPLTSPVRKLIRHHHAILHSSVQAPLPTHIHPSQDIDMFNGMALNGSNGCSGGNGDDGDDGDGGNGGNGGNGSDGGDGGDDGNDDANSDYLEIDSNGDDIVPPAVAARH